MSLPEFNAAIGNMQRAAQKLIDDANKTKRKLVEFDKFQTQNVKLIEENATLKKELDELKNTIAFPKEQIAEISEEQRKAIEKELENWNDEMYWAKDREIDRSNCCDASYYERERASMRDEQSERYLFIQKLMTILGG